MTLSRFLPVLGLVAGILVPGKLLAQQKALPEETRSLLENLEQWEFVEKVHFEEKLKEKRRQVVETLRRHQASQTRLGDLDTALAIKKKADELEALIPNPPGGMVFEMPWDEGEGKVRVLFHPDGTATWTNLTTGDVFKRGFRWAEKAPGWWISGISRENRERVCVGSSTRFSAPPESISSARDGRRRPSASRLPLPRGNPPTGAPWIRGSEIDEGSRARDRTRTCTPEGT